MLMQIALPDSAAVNGWVTGVLLQYLPTLDPKVAVAVAAMAASLAVKAFDWLRSSAAKNGGIWDRIHAVWETWSWLLNPVLLWLVGWLGSGSKVGGLVAGLIGTGLKSWGGHAWTALRTASGPGLQRAAKAGAILAVASLALAAPTRAQTPHKSTGLIGQALYDHLSLSAGLGERWQRLPDAGIDLRPISFAALHGSYAFTDHLAARSRITRDLSGPSAAWGLEVEGVIVF